MNNKESPIWWYTLNCFLYKMLNKALRTLDIEILMKLSFFIRDVHEQIKGRHKKLQTNEIPKLVYRGQVLSSEDLEKLQQNLGGLWSFNCFLSTSVKKDAAKSFAQWFRSPLLNGVLLEIQIDSSTSSVPFSPIRDISAFPNEEILFSIGTVFRINQVYRIEDGLWKINLTLTDDRDSSLNQLTDHIRRSLGQGSGWRQMGQLMIKMQRFDKAREIYYELMKGVASDNHPDNAFIHNQLGFIEKQLGYLDRACSHYETSIRLKLEAMPPNDPRLSSTYSNIGVILKKLNKPDKALEYFQLVLEIDLAASAPNRLEIATDYNNIGSVFDGQGKYAEALKNYQKALDIKLVHLPKIHPSLANNYSNIGVAHRKMGDCSTALSFYQKALDIQTKSLPADHPSFIITYNNMVTAWENLGEYEKAIENAQKAKRTAENALGKQHPEAKKRTEVLHELERKYGRT